MTAFILNFKLYAMTMLRSSIFLFGANFLLSAVLCMMGVPLLRNRHVGQSVREDGPKTHFAKSGTPTFGGVFFLTPLIVSGLIVALARPVDMAYLVIVLLMALFGAVGFYDDYTKVRKDKEGLSVKKKTVFLAAASILFTIWFLYLSPYEPFFIVPLTKQVIEIKGIWKPIYGVFTILYLFFTANAVNITDGIDGLCATLTVISSLSLAYAGYLIAPVLGINYNMHALIWVSMAIAGSAGGFLTVNAHPAKVFMGDTGSLALGAGFAGVALLYGAPWLVLLIGFVYCMEALSSLLQTFYYKISGGKRIFRMAPLHHHFEQEGWSERKILFVFSVIAVIGTAVGLICVM